MKTTADEEAEIAALRFETAFSVLMADIRERVKNRKRAVTLYARLRRDGYILYVEHGSLRVEPTDSIPSRVFSVIQELRPYLEDLAEEANGRG